MIMILKKLYRKNSVFQDFLKMEEVIVTTEYKHHCLHLVYRSMKNNKIRKVSTCIFYYACGSGSFYLLFG